MNGTSEFEFVVEAWLYHEMKSHCFSTEKRSRIESTTFHFSFHQQPMNYWFYWLLVLESEIIKLNFRQIVFHFLAAASMPQHNRKMKFSQNKYALAMQNKLGWSIKKFSFSAKQKGAKKEPTKASFRRPSNVNWMWWANECENWKLKIASASYRHLQL